MNYTVIIAAAKALLMRFNPALLPENGGSLVIGNSLAQSVSRRMNYVKRKSTTGKILPPNFDDVKEKFSRSLKDIIHQNHIPEDLVLNIEYLQERLKDACLKLIQTIQCS